MKIEKILEKILRIVAFLGVIVFVTLSIISITIPSFKQNFMLGRQKLGTWQETPDRASYRCYMGSLKVWWAALDTGANKPLIRIEHGFSWIDILEISAWASSLLITQNNKTLTKNIFWDHHLHLKTGEELQAAWVSKESNYTFLQKVRLCKKNKFSFVESEYSLVQKGKNLQDASLYLTNWLYHGDAIFIPDSGWQTLEGELKGNQEAHLLFKLTEPYYVLYFKKQDIGFLVFSIFSKTPNSLGVTRTKEGIRTIDFSISLESEFYQSIFVKLLYDKEWEDIPVSFIEKEISKIFK